MKTLSYITQSSCRKVLGKMPDISSEDNGLASHPKKVIHHFHIFTASIIEFFPTFEDFKKCNDLPLNFHFLLMNSNNRYVRTCEKQTVYHRSS